MLGRQIQRDPPAPTSEGRRPAAVVLDRTFSFAELGAPDGLSDANARRVCVWTLVGRAERILGERWLAERGRLPSDAFLCAFARLAMALDCHVPAEREDASARLLAWVLARELLALHGGGTRWARFDVIVPAYPEAAFRRFFDDEIAAGRLRFLDASLREAFLSRELGGFSSDDATVADFDRVSAWTPAVFAALGDEPIYR
ncbi:MAG: hypothetical protein H6825_06200 [Planctomycetes bacterium]|nr:hypothetical protein [Planctomycetota bacterium]